MNQSAEETAVGALTEAARLLDEGDVEAAAKAVTVAAAFMRPGSDLSLSIHGIRQARALLDRCVTSEARLRREVVGALAKDGNRRRAIAAYDE